MKLVKELKKEIVKTEFNLKIYLDSYGETGYRVKVEGESADGSIKLVNSIIRTKSEVRNDGVEIYGKTYDIKDELKKLGFKWDSLEKAWVNRKAFIKEAMDFVKATNIDDAIENF